MCASQRHFGLFKWGRGFLHLSARASIAMCQSRCVVSLRHYIPLDPFCSQVIGQNCYSAHRQLLHFGCDRPYNVHHHKTAMNWCTNQRLNVQYIRVYAHTSHSFTRSWHRVVSCMLYINTTNAYIEYQVNWILSSVWNSVERVAEYESVCRHISHSRSMWVGGKLHSLCEFHIQNGQYRDVIQNAVDVWG